jgi:hypothetical protein
MVPWMFSAVFITMISHLKAWTAYLVMRNQGCRFAKSKRRPPVILPGLPKLATTKGKTQTVFAGNQTAGKTLVC